MVVSEPAGDTALHHFPHPPPKIVQIEITLLLQTTCEESHGMTRPCQLRLCKSHQHQVREVMIVPEVAASTKDMHQTPPISFHVKCKSLMEHPELQRTHKDHEDQLWTLSRADTASLEHGTTCSSSLAGPQGPPIRYSQGTV